MYEKNLNFLVLAGTAKKALKQAAEMEHELSAYILFPTLAILYQAKVGLKYMHSVRVSSQLLASGFFIAIPTNTENFKIFSYTCMLYT